MKTFFSVIGSFLIFFILFSFRSDEISMFHTDEQYYTQSGRNMVESGDWITPVFDGKKRFQKPILQYWLVASSYKVLGISPYSARIWAAIFASLGILITYFTTNILFGRKTALLSALILPASYIYFLQARLAYTDMTLSFFITLSLFSFIRGYFLFEKNGDSKKYFLLFYVSMALATLAKGHVGFILPILIVSIFIITTKNYAILRKMYIPGGIMIFLLIALPWFIIMLRLHGMDYLNQIIYTEGVERMFPKSKFTLYYPFAMIRYYFPWSLFLIAAVVRIFSLRKGIFEKGNQPILFFIIWFLTILVFFVIFRIEHSRYLLPSSPAIAIIVGRYLSKADDCRREVFPEIRWILGLVCIIYSFAVIAMIITILILLHLDLLPMIIIGQPLILIIGIAFLIWRYKFSDNLLSENLYFKENLFHITIGISVMQFTTFIFLTGYTFPLVLQSSLPEFSKRILAKTNKSGFRSEGARIGSYKLRHNKEKLIILLGLPVERIEHRERLYDFLGSGKEVLCIIRKEDYLKLPSLLRDRLTLIREGLQWRKIRINRKWITLLLNGELKGKEKDFKETTYLLINRYKPLPIEKIVPEMPEVAPEIIRKFFIIHNFSPL